MFSQIYIFLFKIFSNLQSIFYDKLEVFHKFFFFKRRVKAEMESQGSQLKHEREKQIYEKRAELDKLNQEKHAKQAIKDEAETHEKAALDVIREEEDRQRALKV